MAFLSSFHVALQFVSFSRTMSSHIGTTFNPATVFATSYILFLSLIDQNPTPMSSCSCLLSSVSLPLPGDGRCAFPGEDDELHTLEELEDGSTGLLIRHRHE